MAASTALSTAANPTQLCRSRAALGTPVKGLGFGRGLAAPRTVTICQAGSVAADRVPDMEKRKLMNLLLLGAVSLPTVGMVVPYGSFFVPGGSVLFTLALLTTSYGSGNADGWLRRWLLVRLVSPLSPGRVTPPAGPTPRTSSATTSRSRSGLRRTAPTTARSLRASRVTPRTWSWSRTRPWRPTGSTPCAPTSGAWCRGTPPRTSSSAPATDPSTTTRARSSADRLRCRWPWFTPTSTTARSSSSRGWRPTSGPARTPGGRRN